MPLLAHTFWVNGWQATDGPDLREFGCGSIPGWKWLGSPGASESVGYPYTLASIAGRPTEEFHTSAALSTALSDGFGILEDRTCYLVATVTGKMPGSNSDPFMQYGSVMTDVTPNTYLTPRIEYGPGAADHFRVRRTGGVGPSLAGAVPVGPNIYAFGLEAGLAWAETPAMARVVEATSMTDMRHRALFIYGASPYAGAEKHLLIYRGMHNQSTRNRVYGWLARKYGAPIPAGY